MVPAYVFPLVNLLPCTQEVPDAHLLWSDMVASPLKFILQNGIKAVMLLLQAALEPVLGFLDNKKMKLAGEINCYWHLIASGPATAPDFMKRESKIRQALAQLYGYMNVNDCRVSVLTTYTYTWFVSRTGVMGVSLPISYNSELSTLFECFYYLVCEMEQTGFQYDRSVGLTTQIYSSEKSETPGHERGDVNRADSAQNLGESFAQDYCWSSLQLDLRLGSGLHSSAWLGSFDEQHAVIKLYDFNKEHQTYWRTEMEAYLLHKDLQGVMIPQVIHFGTIDGMAGFIGMNFCGESCTSVSFEDVRQLRETISKLHAKKVAHGDIRLENFTRSENSRIWLIDFWLFSDKCK